MSEEKFWKCTPRKFFALVDAHNKANTLPDEENEGNKKLPSKNVEMFTLEDFKRMGVGNIL